MSPQQSGFCSRRDYSYPWRTSRPLRPEMWAELATTAADLSGENPLLPVKMSEICQRLGVRVARSAKMTKRSGYLIWRRERGETPVIMLPSDRISRWDRFCAAHEIAHFLLISRYGWHPEDESRYWETEAMCDFFARELLVPTAAFRDLTYPQANIALEACNRLADQAKVPWIQAAKKMTEADPALVILRLEWPKDWLTVVASSLPREKGRGIKIKTRVVFADTVGQMSRLALEQMRPTSSPLSRDEFIGSSLGELFSELAVTDIVGEASPVAESFKLVGIRKRIRFQEES